MKKLPDRREFLTMGALGAAALLGGCTAAGNAPAMTPDGNPAARGNLITRGPVAPDAEFSGIRTAQEVRKQGRLVVGANLAKPLMSERNEINGEFEGFDATLAKLLAKYLVGSAVTEVIPCSADTKEPLLETGVVNVVIDTYSITPERAGKVSFAGPYLAAGQAIATLKTRAGITGPADLRRATVAVVSNTTSVDAVRQLVPTAAQLVLPTSQDCVLALEQKRADAYVHDLVVLAGAAHLNDHLKLVGEPFTNEWYGIGVRHGDTAFKNVINAWLRQIEETGLWAEAWRQSLGTVVEGGVPAPPAIGSVPGS
jgi:glutamate transport system substrate-binding protein